METLFEELDVVQVVALLDSNRQFSGTEGICRAPRVGDIATIVHVLENDRIFIVEAVDADGFTLWLADFDAKELQLKIKYRADV